MVTIGYYIKGVHGKQYRNCPSMIEAMAFMLFLEANPNCVTYEIERRFAE